jgi:hypothetical protein
LLESQPFGIPQQQSPFFHNAHITTQMAPLVVPLPDREIQVIHDHHHLGEKVGKPILQAKFASKMIRRKVLSPLKPSPKNSF